eukprot:NODE_2609_length_907_cov_191.254695.p7 GENE.NODE_2609_length_907_cov_191.254695~~NODE_2609_length_907_cov_191.254695.p7  ORF type:complete len:84 (+),score=22.56 NODE_2609_length_907_cov_191.254695:3-254(+)
MGGSSATFLAPKDTFNQIDFGGKGYITRDDWQAMVEEASAGTNEIVPKVESMVAYPTPVGGEGAEAARSLKMQKKNKKSTCCP